LQNSRAGVCLLPPLAAAVAVAEAGVLDSVVVAPSVESFRDFFVDLATSLLADDDDLVTVGVGDESNGVS